MVSQDFNFHRNILFKAVINKKVTCIKSNYILKLKINMFIRKHRTVYSTHIKIDT